MKENENNISLSSLGNSPILSEQSKEQIVRLYTKREELNSLKATILKEIDIYLTQNIDKIEEKIHDLQNNSTQSQIQKNIEKLSYPQTLTFSNMEDLVSFFRPCIQKTFIDNKQKFEFIASEPNFQSNEIDIDTDSMLYKIQKYMEHMSDIIVTLQVGFENIQKNETPQKIQPQKFALQHQSLRQFNYSNPKQQQQQMQQQFQQQQQFQNQMQLQNINKQSVMQFQRNNNSMNKNIMMNGHINNIQESITPTRKNSIGENQLNNLPNLQLQQHQQQQLQQQQSNETQIAQQQQQNQQEQIKAQQQKILLQQLEMDQKLKQEKLQKEKKQISSETRLQLRSLEHYCDALEIQYLSTWAVSFKVDQENASISGFNHFPIFESDASHYDCLQEAEIQVFIVKGNCIQLGKKIYSQTFHLKKSNKSSNEEDYLEQLNFSQSVQVEKGQMYSIVIVNISQEQFDDPEKRLFICYGDLQDNNDEKEKNKLEFFNSDFTNIQHFMEIEDVQSSQVKNDRLDEGEIQLSDYFISNIIYEVQDDSQQYSLNKNSDNKNKISVSQSPEKRNPFQTAIITNTNMMGQNSNMLNTSNAKQFTNILNTGIHSQQQQSYFSTLINWAYDTQYYDISIQEQNSKTNTIQRTQTQINMLYDYIRQVYFDQVFFKIEWENTIQNHYLKDSQR
ncbi:hypothetical protein PPERSA_05787 [Pseudocohnilembus persalinus]|uniref:Uncharacterized protein n=1 Tax=Pseudocohnilembus persalinus TaxID=266149 RepID=A0A0V0QZK6_PSEPJ|nr:hypothetical protein PPERSA_05787 [Pseudocohnilembus persalinus]|eukprot:KRX07724.1 hypothetical protein PPERSA_05787 [Pseudocohnilembus persalinus]